jgi:hypothetical protein
MHIRINRTALDVTNSRYTTFIKIQPSPFLNNLSIFLRHIIWYVTITCIGLEEKQLESKISSVFYFQIYTGNIKDSEAYFVASKETLSECCSNSFHSRHLWTNYIMRCLDILWKRIKVQRHILKKVGRG